MGKPKQKTNLYQISKDYVSGNDETELAEDELDKVTGGGERQIIQDVTQNTQKGATKNQEGTDILIRG